MMLVRLSSVPCMLFLGRMSFRGCMWPYSFDWLRETYMRFENLCEFAAFLDLPVSCTRRAMRLAGFEKLYVSDLYEKYCEDQTLSAIASDNGMKVATLSNLFKKYDMKVKRGRKTRRKLTLVEIARALRKLVEDCRRHPTVNQLALELGSYWANIHRMLLKEGVIFRGNGRWEFVIYGASYQLLWRLKPSKAESSRTRAFRQSDCIRSGGKPF